MAKTSRKNKEVSSQHLRDPSRVWYSEDVFRANTIIHAAAIHMEVRRQAANLASTDITILHAKIGIASFGAAEAIASDSTRRCYNVSRHGDDLQP